MVFLSTISDGRTITPGRYRRSVWRRWRSIRLDIKAVDRTNKHFDIEIQRADSGADAKRARFHGSMIDRELLEKNQDFKELPESFIIFITENDKYERGVPVYHIERTIEEKEHALFEDGLHILYVNGECRDADTPVGRLMHDFHCTKSEDMYSKVLAEEVKYLKETTKSLLALGKFSHEDISKGTGLPLEGGEELAAQNIA